MQSAYALRICIADTDRGSVRMEMYTNAKEEAKQLKIGGGGGGGGGAQYHKDDRSTCREMYKALPKLG